MTVTRFPYVVRALHGGVEVARDAFSCRDGEHALRVGQYVALALAREHVHPREFDASLVSVEVEPFGPEAVRQTLNAGLVTAKL